MELHRGNWQENYCRCLLSVSILERTSPLGGKRISMTLVSKTTDAEPRQPPWAGIVKFLLLALLIVLIFLLGQSMVSHRFFRGGWVSDRNVLKP